MAHLKYSGSQVQSPVHFTGINSQWHAGSQVHQASDCGESHMSAAASRGFSKVSIVRHAPSSPAGKLLLAFGLQRNAVVQIVLTAYHSCMAANDD